MYERRILNINHARLVPGLLLIALGCIFLLGQYFEFGPALFLIILGIAFLVPSFISRSDAMLIPGCILIGIGLGLAFDRPPLGTAVAVPIGLGLGFLAIFVIQLVTFRQSHWWPLIPGFILIFIGVLEGIPQAELLIKKGWPLILVLIGLLMLGGQYWRPNRSTKI
jgi:hypothetical protein